MTLLLMLDRFEEASLGGLRPAPDVTDTRSNIRLEFDLLLFKLLTTTLCLGCLGVCWPRRLYVRVEGLDMHTGNVPWGGWSPRETAYNSHPHRVLLLSSSQLLLNKASSLGDLFNHCHIFWKTQRLFPDRPLQTSALSNWPMQLSGSPFNMLTAAALLILHGLGLCLKTCYTCPGRLDGVQHLMTFTSSTE
jgi:hypothetical protein